MPRIITAIISASLIFIASTSHAYQVRHGFFSPTGGALKQGSNTIVQTSSMQPYGTPTRQDLNPLNGRALALLTDGSAFLNSLSFYGCESDPATCGGNVCLARLLRNEIPSYEDCPAFVTGLQTGETNLKTAIRNFAYLSEYDYPDARFNLRKSLRNLVSLYLVFADELLVDALHLRFSANLTPTDQYLSQQSVLLGRALDHYQKGARAFISVSLEPIGWADQVVGELFEQEDWDLFNVLYGRISTAAREKVVKDRALMAEPLENVKQRLATSVAELHVEAALMASKLGDSFLELRGKDMLAALNSLEKQLGDLRSGLNPLGYNDRHVPLAEFEKSDGTGLYHQADDIYKTCNALEATGEQADRNFDQQLSQYGLQMQQLSTSYRSQLGELTGCSQSLGDAELIECAGYAGDELFLDCPMDLETDAFNACLQRKENLGVLGVLGEKYRQIKDADLALERAQLQFDNVNKQIDIEIASQNYQVKLLSAYFDAQEAAWHTYQKAMKNVCTITKTYEKVKKNGVTTVTKEKSTTKSLTLKDTGFKAQITKETDILEAMRTLQVQQMLDIKPVQSLLLQQADALIGIDVAVNHKNTMLAAFEAGLRQRDNTLALWRQSQSAYGKYLSQGLASQRILLSDFTLGLSRNLNELAHFAYLASKALEYRYAEPLTGINLGATGVLNLTDLFKCQNAADFGAYLHKLKVYNDSWCGQRGTFTKDRYGISLALDILGLTNKELGDANRDGLVDATGRPVEEVRYEKVQQFINNHIDSSGNLTFNLATSVFSSSLQSFGRENIKIWHGTIPCSSSGGEGKGLTASLFFKGSVSGLNPRMSITQKGTHTLRRTSGETVQYLPINTYTMLSADDNQPPFTEDMIQPFNGVDLLPKDSDSTWGSWSWNFTNRSAAAGEWQISLRRESVYPDYYQDVPFGKLRDIWFYFDAIGQ